MFGVVCSCLSLYSRSVFAVTKCYKFRPRTRIALNILFYKNKTIKERGRESRKKTLSQLNLMSHSVWFMVDFRQFFFTVLFIRPSAVRCKENKNDGKKVFDFNLVVLAAHRRAARFCCFSRNFTIFTSLLFYYCFSLTICACSFFPNWFSLFTLIIFHFH